jgi:hypothetical protein
MSVSYERLKQRPDSGNAPDVPFLQHPQIF